MLYYIYNKDAPVDQPLTEIGCFSAWLAMTDHTAHGWFWVHELLSGATETHFYAIILSKVEQLDFFFKLCEWISLETCSLYT